MSEAINAERNPVHQAVDFLRQAGSYLVHSAQAKAALGGGIAMAAFPGAALANGASTESQQIAGCEQAALNSYHFDPHSNTYRYIDRGGTNLRSIEWGVEADALPTDCIGKVARTIRVVQSIGPDRNHLKQNTRNRVVSTSNGAVNKRVDLRTWQLFGSRDPSSGRRNNCVSGNETFTAVGADGTKKVGNHRLTVSCK